jgi:hypothetical protein
LTARAGSLIVPGQEESWRTSVFALAILVTLAVVSVPGLAAGAESFDVVIVGGTPGGIMAGIAAARLGQTVLLVERTGHIGGLPANGLGATDIHTRGATGGLFREFVDRVKRDYVARYGTDSPQVRDCSDGYHFEPSVAERILEEMLAEHKGRLEVRRLRQFDALPRNVSLRGSQLTAIRVMDRTTGSLEEYLGKVFIDATYEGDLAAAAGVPFRTGREGKAEYHEELAGRVYKKWGGPVGEGSTFEADQAIQAYNYRLCLTDDPGNLTRIAKPVSYRRDEYVSLIEDLRLGRHTGVDGPPQGIQWVVNRVKLPNGKFDANNQHLAFISTDLPEENWPWPTADWEWRDRFAIRLRDYTLGLLWFAQNDPELPAAFRTECGKWGLAANEYPDNDSFPRQVYVREGRRFRGEHWFTTHDSLPVAEGRRPPVHKTSITASHYAIDSHAVRKREPQRVHLDGFLSSQTAPYTVPYGVMVPTRIDGLLIPVPVSGTHLGFSTLRMEPCWMALGQAAGTAAAVSIESSTSLRKLNVRRVQQKLLEQKAVLIYFRDLGADDPLYPTAAMLALDGWLIDWNVDLEATVLDQEAKNWFGSAERGLPAWFQSGHTTRRQLLDFLHKD